MANMVNNKVNITAVVASCNEGHLLNTCLQSLQFCNEIIVVNLESTDNTVEVAQKNNAIVLNHPKVKIVEIIRQWIIDKTKNDWILFVDPDEFLMPNLQRQISDLFNKGVDETIGVVAMPYQFFFKNKMLKGTVWGGNINRFFLRNKFRNTFTGLVHTDMHLKSGYMEYIIQRESDNYIHHAWMQSLEQLIEKHKRYLLNEGKAMYESGIRYKIKRHAYWTVKSFYDSYILKKGVKDGFEGLILSFFYAWYTFNKWNRLKLYEQGN